MRLASSLPRLPLLLVLLACLGFALPGCGGGSTAELPTDDHHAESGTVTVSNNSGVFWPILRLAAPNGTATVTNVPIGGVATFTNVAYGTVTATAYAANGTSALAGASGVLNSPNLSLPVF